MWTRSGLIISIACISLYSVALILFTAHTNWNAAAHLADLTSLSVTQPILTICSVLRQVEFVSQKIKRCVSSTNANYGKETPSHRAVVVVSHRETVIGCHSFHRFLMQNAETIFVFDEEFIRIWKLEELVRNATRNQTMGVHLVVTKTYGAEIVARRIALEFIDQFDPRLEYIFSINCDLHEMPEDYAGYKSFSEMMPEFSKVFDYEKNLRKLNQTIVEFADGQIENSFYRILAISAVHVEDTEAKIRHGADVGNWLSRGGIGAKPISLGDSPWISDSTYYIETHLIFIDAKALKSISSIYFIIESINPEPKTVPQICTLGSLAMLQHNEFVVFMDFVNNSAQLESKNYVNYLSDRDFSDMLLYNFEVLAERRNPKYVYDEFHALNNVGIRMLFQFGLQFVVRQIRPHWIPSFKGKSCSDDRVLRFMNAAMKIAGYSQLETEEKGILKFSAGMCFPQSVQLQVSQNSSGDHVFGILNCSDSTYYLSSNFPNRIVFRNLSLSNRTITFPARNNCIVEKLTSTVTNAFTKIMPLA